MVDSTDTPQQPKSANETMAEWHRALARQERRPVRDAELVNLMTDPRFLTFMNLILEVKQGHMLALCGVDINTLDGSREGMRLQGRISALDGLVDIVQDVLVKEEARDDSTDD